MRLALLYDQKIGTFRNRLPCVRIFHEHSHEDSKIFQKLSMKCNNEQKELSTQTNEICNKHKGLVHHLQTGSCSHYIKQTQNENHNHSVTIETHLIVFNS